MWNPSINFGFTQLFERMGVHVMPAFLLPVLLPFRVQVLSVLNALYHANDFSSSHK